MVLKRTCLFLVGLEKDRFFFFFFFFVEIPSLSASFHCKDSVGFSKYSGIKTGLKYFG